MNEKVANALDQVDDAYIAHAARKRKKRHIFYVAVAAVLALVLFWNAPSIPLAVSAKAVSLASESRKRERPNVDSDEYDLWLEETQQRRTTANEILPSIADFSGQCSKAILTGPDNTNQLWSPVNAYIALAMTAELTAGTTQQQLLDVLGAGNTEQLRQGISAVWESIYQDNGKEVSVLANSLWLDDEMKYHQDVMDLLSQSYYASVYQGDLGSTKTNRAMRNWLNNETGGFLKDRTQNVSLSPDSTLSLLSTIYFQGKWYDEFSSGKNTEDVFHTPAGEVECTYMNAEERKMNYYWGEDFGAVALRLQNGGSMWFILPDEDKTIQDVLQRGEYMDIIANTGDQPIANEKYMKVNLSVPKFDVSASTDLKPGLQSMGITQIFEPLGNDFSPSFDTELPIYLDSINQDTRVAIDEKGVVAASYIVLEFGAGAAEPPEEIIDFVLDRPFLFAICKDQIPLFMGSVNQP